MLVVRMHETGITVSVYEATVFIVPGENSTIEIFHLERAALSEPVLHTGSHN